MQGARRTRNTRRRVRLTAARCSHSRSSCSRSKLPSAGGRIFDGQLRNGKTHVPAVREGDPHQVELRGQPRSVDATRLRETMKAPEVTQLLSRPRGRFKVDPADFERLDRTGGRAIWCSSSWVNDPGRSSVSYMACKIHADACQPDASNPTHSSPDSDDDRIQFRASCGSTHCTDGHSPETESADAARASSALPTALDHSARWVEAPLGVHVHKR